MEMKDIKEETRNKISFPDETEIEEDWQRIMLTTHHLMEYLLDIGLDPQEVYRTIMFMGLKRYLTAINDLESARQEALIYLDTALEDELTERKKFKRVQVSMQISFHFHRFKVAAYSTINLYTDFKIN